MTGKASTFTTIDGKYRLTVSPVSRGGLRMTVTDGKGSVVNRFAVDVVKLAHALELATGVDRKVLDDGTEVSMV